ncbi:MAG: sodium:solute symporter [candidate division Zixibacteria bacterium]|nr:sodium:solute symporter [candidate division Zixibacteria bacterium]
MNLGLVDWLIVAIALVFMIVTVSASKRLMKSVADFLAAGRSAGRYVISVASGVAGLGAITVIGNLEMNLLAGFSMAWWGMTMALVLLVITVSGWVIYRFRQTRSLTLAQFFEVRYSRNFRIFTGIVAFLSGLINFGIFPAVGARFFIYFCGLPQSFELMGLSIVTFPLVMILLLGVSLYFVFTGGQIAVIIADFFQGLFVNIIFVIIIVYLFFTFDWVHIFEALSSAPQEASLINPFHTSQVEDFNFWYFLVGVFGVMYGTMSWQGTQGYNASAKNAHEAKMGGVLAGWRGLPQTLLFLFVPIIAYTVLHHPDFAHIAQAVHDSIAGAGTDAVQSQLKVPLVLSHILPRGLIGGLAAVMLAAFISTHDSYLHSWGSILVQDVIMPFRKKPFTPKQHLRALRLAITCVAVFIFFFSLLFKQSEYIFLFFAITGAIFAGGSGAIIIGGLYWKRGTTSAAWAAMITGSSIAVGGIIIHQLVDNFFINGQWFWMISMFGSSLVYIAVSLLGKKDARDMDKVLKRGKYAIKDETTIIDAVPSKGWKILGMGKEFTKGDKFIYIINYIWTGGMTIVFLAGTIYNLNHEVSDQTWLEFWKIYIEIQVVLAVISIIWFTIGGFKDIRIMIARLTTMKRDEGDDGFIHIDNITGGSDRE